MSERLVRNVDGLSVGGVIGWLEAWSQADTTVQAVALLLPIHTALCWAFFLRWKHESASWAKLDKDRPAAGTLKSSGHAEEQQARWTLCPIKTNASVGGKGQNLWAGFVQHWHWRWHWHWLRVLEEHLPRVELNWKVLIKRDDTTNQTKTITLLVSPCWPCWLWMMSWGVGLYLGELVVFFMAGDTEINQLNPQLQYEYLTLRRLLLIY